MNQTEIQPDENDAQQEVLHFRIAARIRGILYYRTANLLALSLVAILSRPLIGDTSLFLLALSAALGLNAAHLFLHLGDSYRAGRWLAFMLADVAAYSALGA